MVLAGIGTEDCRRSRAEPGRASGQGKKGRLGRQALQGLKASLGNLFLGINGRSALLAGPHSPLIGGSAACSSVRPLGQLVVIPAWDSPAILELGVTQEPEIRPAERATTRAASARSCTWPGTRRPAR